MRLPLSGRKWEDFHNSSQKISQDKQVQNAFTDFLLQYKKILSFGKTVKLSCELVHDRFPR